MVKEITFKFILALGQTKFPWLLSALEMIVKATKAMKYISVEVLLITRIERKEFIGKLLIYYILSKR